MSRPLQFQPLVQGNDTHPLRSILDPTTTTHLLSTPPPPTHLDLKPLLSKNRQSETITAFTLASVLTPQECRSMIERTESLGYQIALVNVGGGAGAGAGVHLPGYRDGKRCIIDDVAFAAELWDRVKRHIPPVWEGRPVVGMNERLRFLKYHPNDQFAPHMDGEYRRTDGSGQVTKITIQFYLNSEGDIEAGAEAALRGGQTTFLDERFEYSEVKGGPEAFRKQVAVPCRTGQALVFQHDLVHEGSKVQAGIKYVVRTDILYGPRPNNYNSIRLGL